jgi:hypothetical protein
VAIRLDWRLRDASGHFDRELWNLRAAIGTSVGWCSCGGPANGTRLDLDSPTVRCYRCGAEAVVPLRTLVRA